MIALRPIHQRATVALLLLVIAGCGGPGGEEELLAIRQAEDTRDPGHGRLLKDLADGTRPVRAAAARALGRIGHPSGLPPLLQALGKEDEPEVRQEIAFALGILGDPGAVPALVRAAGSERDPSTLAEIAIALGRLGDPAALDTLHDLLGTSWVQVRERAVEALALLADPRSIDPLVELVADPDPEVAWRATYALEKIESDRQVPALVEATRAEDPMVRRAAVRSLGRLGAGTEAVVAALASSSGDWQMQVRIADALGRIGENSPGVRATIEHLLESDSFHVQVAALQAVGRAKWMDLLPRALDLRASPVVDVRAAAYEATADCLDGRARDVLVPGIEDPSPIVAAACLRRLGESSAEDVVEILEARVAAGGDRIRRLGAAGGLAAAGERVAIGTMIGLLNDRDPFVAVTAAEALGERGDAAAVLPLLAALERSEPGLADLRLSAATALGAIGDDRAVETLQATLRDDPDVRVRLSARDALAEMLPPPRAAGLPEPETIRADVRPVTRSPAQPDVVVRSSASQLVLHTDRGRILIDLFGEDAPQMVESFAALAEEGFFDGLGFHRVVGDFVVQGGDPTGTGWGDAGYTLRSEWNRRRYGRGTVGIAHSGKDTGSCQLFVTQSPQPHLDARYTVWGEVVSGMEVVDRIQRGDRFRAEVVRNGG